MATNIGQLLQQGLLTGVGSTQQPVQQAVPGSPNFYGEFMAARGRGLQQGLGRLARGGEPSTQERIQGAMFELSSPTTDGTAKDTATRIADLTKLARVQQVQGNTAAAAQTAAQVQQLREQEQQKTQGAAFSSYVGATFKNPELTKLAAEGVLTPNNLDSFIQDTSNATMLKGSTFTVRDSKENSFTMIPTLNNKTGELENMYSPIGDAPDKPVGKTIITGGEFAQTADEDTQRRIEQKGLETQEAKFQELKVAATDAIPTLNASKDNLDRATTLLNDVSTGGPVNLAGTGLENFFGVKGADKAELEIILGQEMFKSLKPLFGGVISEGERQAIVDIYANLKKGNVANRGILKRLKQELNDGILKARLYQKAENYEEFNLAVKQMFPETPSEKRVIVFGQRDGENNE
jgi:hypothetical protein